MVYDDYDLSRAARKALSDAFGSRFNIQYENAPSSEPHDGTAWLKFDYLPADTIYQSLDRKCKSIIGMVQIGIVIPPDSGIDSHRLLAKEIANFFEDGKILGVGYVSVGGQSHPIQKSDRGWFLPVRFYVRYDGK